MSAPVKPKGIPRLVLLAVALLLPALSLIPLGSLWLWQHGLVLYWALASVVLVGAVYYFERRLIVPLPPAGANTGSTKDATDPENVGDGSWTPRQTEAWANGLRWKRASP